MKSMIASLVLAAVPAMAQQAAPAPTLVAGSEVKLEAVTSAKWVQGEPLKAFEPGKVYVFECWATWCGPCVAAIPHVNELHQKYQSKGLRVIGMNVWEDGLEKVEKFVKAKGDGMSYPVAYTGKGSAFENDWLKAAGVTGIPRALIVRNGKLLMGVHPSSLTDELIESLLGSDEQVKKAVEEVAQREQSKSKTMPMMQQFFQASQKGDAAAMEKCIAEVEKLDAKSPQLGMMKTDLLMVKKDFDAVKKLLVDTTQVDARRNMVMMLAGRLVDSKEDEAYPVDFVKTVTEVFTETHLQGATPVRPMTIVMKSMLEWKSGDKAAAAKSAQEAETAARTQAGTKPVSAFEKLTKSVTDGTMPTRSEFYRWLSADMKASRPAAK